MINFTHSFSFSYFLFLSFSSILYVETLLQLKNNVREKSYINNWYYKKLLLHIKLLLLYEIIIII